MKDTRSTTLIRTHTISGLLARLREDEGATAAEYAVTVLAACAFAALLFAIITSGAIHDLVLGIITRALGLAG